MFEGFSDWRLLSPEEKFGFVCGWIVGLAVLGGLTGWLISLSSAPSARQIEDNSGQIAAWLIALPIFALLAYGAARLALIGFAWVAYSGLRRIIWPRRWRRWTPEERDEWWNAVGQHRMGWVSRIDAREAKVDIDSAVFPRRSPNTQLAEAEKPPKDYSPHIFWLKVGLGVFAALVLTGWVTGWSSTKYVIHSCVYLRGDGFVTCISPQPPDLTADEPSPYWSSFPPCRESGFTSVPIAALEAQARSSADDTADATCALIKHSDNLGITVFGNYIGF